MQGNVFSQIGLEIGLALLLKQQKEGKASGVLCCLAPVGVVFEPYHYSIGCFHLGRHIGSYGNLNMVTNARVFSLCLINFRFY